jgi:hypothetical protein
MQTEWCKTKHELRTSKSQRKNSTTRTPRRAWIVLVAATPAAKHHTGPCRTVPWAWPLTTTLYVRRRRYHLVGSWLTRRTPQLRPLLPVTVLASAGCDAWTQATPTIPGKILAWASKHSRSRNAVSQQVTRSRRNHLNIVTFFSSPHHSETICDDQPTYIHIQLIEKRWS